MKVILSLLLFTLCTGCDSIADIFNDDSVDYQIIFDNYYDRINNVTTYQEESQYFDITLTVTQNSSSYNYQIVVNNPLNAMINVQAMVINNANYTTKNDSSIPSIGLLSEDTVNLIPNQVDADYGYYDSITLTGTSNALPDTYRLIISWYNENRNASYVEFYELEVEETGTYTY